MENGLKNVEAHEAESRHHFSDINSTKIKINESTNAAAYNSIIAIL